ncbi:phage tail protein [Pseudomonas sp. MPR-ANC1]|uniref:phage tail assembly chaperone n=1 Tax=Pseudomonas sp. MPR-ANC1 TaxID=2075548 RepID=UPI000CD18E32|nr:phage tail assembly chaperone [Pseudomonas sp. MPR-ANC1]POA45620.1 phage tail protein [Pseudomonas sp. MPR-ANC1]
MKRFYSQTTGCTYLLGLHPSMPADAVEISDELCESVICNPAPGTLRLHDENGLPYLVDVVTPVEALAVQERAWRDAELSAVLWLRERHRDQLELSGATTLTGEQFQELLVYMQALRDWPQSPEFPASQSRPTPPQWLASAQEDNLAGSTTQTVQGGAE